MAAFPNLILGVDGGGTKTVAWLAQVDARGKQQILGRGRTGSSNLKAVGPEIALTNLNSAVQQAWSEANRSREQVAVAVLGLSGAGQPDAQELIRSWDRQHGISRHLLVVHDARPVLMAGTPQGIGVAFIAGTGAVAFAADSQGNTAIVGGWGYWFGDEGSAYWLGQAAARAVSHANDGRAAGTLLTQAVLDRLTIKEPREILTTLSSKGDVRSAIAGLADLVSLCAEEGDKVASQIVTEAAGHLAALVTAAAKKLELGTSFPLGVAGGVVCGSRFVREALLDALAAQGVFPSPVELVADPVSGCLRIAEDALAAQDVG